MHWVCGLWFSKQLDGNHSSLCDLLMLSLLFSDESTALAVNLKFVFVIHTVLAHFPLPEIQVSVIKEARIVIEVPITDVAWHIR